MKWGYMREARARQRGKVHLFDGDQALCRMGTLGTEIGLTEIKPAAVCGNCRLVMKANGYACP